MLFEIVMRGDEPILPAKLEAPPVSIPEVSRRATSADRYVEQPQAP
jgi:hypothetical protein